MRARKFAGGMMIGAAAILATAALAAPDKPAGTQGYVPILMPKGCSETEARMQIPAAQRALIEEFSPEQARYTRPRRSGTARSLRSI